MENKQELQKAEEIFGNIVAKCWEDENFKNRLINHPEATIKEFTNKEFSLPGNKVLKVQDQTDEGCVYLNIPRKPDVENVELNEKELESVAGGIGVLATVALGLLGCAIYDFCDGFIDGVTS